MTHRKPDPGPKLPGTRPRFRPRRNPTSLPDPPHRGRTSSILTRRFHSRPVIHGVQEVPCHRYPRRFVPIDTGFEWTVLASSRMNPPARRVDHDFYLTRICRRPLFQADIFIRESSRRKFLTR